MLYAADQNWRLWTVVTEIAVRFYLTIGFVAFLGLAVLTWTSSDHWVKRLGAKWKRLQKWVYAIGVLAAAALLPAIQGGRVGGDRGCRGVRLADDLARSCRRDGTAAGCRCWALRLLAAAVTLGVEFAWYRFGTKIDPMRVLRGEFNLTYGVHPAGLVLVLGIAVALVTELRAIGQGSLGTRPAYAGAGLCRRGAGGRRPCA